jgi:vacuolar-type H+-ATPase subunit H
MTDEPDSPEQRPELAEAEAMLDTLLDRARQYAGRTLALAREEAEDMWAEAQELRRRHES